MAEPAAKLAMAPQASETRYGDFKPVAGSTGATLYVLQEKANHPKSMTLLSAAGLRPMTYQELLPLLMKDEALKNALKGKWFWLAGEGMEKAGIFTINEKGELREITKKEKLSVEQKVRVWPGEQPLSFVVLSDADAADCGRRFDLGASLGPQGVAPVVVGVPADREAVTPKNGTQPDVPAHLLRKAKDQFIELRKHQKPETIDAIEEILGSL